MIPSRYTSTLTLCIFFCDDLRWLVNIQHDKKQTILTLKINNIPCAIQFSRNVVARIHLVIENARLDSFGIKFPHEEIVP